MSASSVDEDLQNLHSMFPELDKETVGEILRDQGGSVERAVEVLLKFCGDSDQGTLQPTMPVANTSAGTTRFPSGSEAEAGMHTQLAGEVGARDPHDSEEGDTFAIPGHDFLTIGRYMRHASSSSSAPATRSSNLQTEYDEALARQLQDTFFLSELQNRPEMRQELYGAWHGEEGVGA
eukprot:CAMPEP_0173422312 /NCGR_PEP_ID=MMETSP1357-20121228/3070_1 /TAXON_ID=77926 /ORGANISM="Hemiselmis rufescens, Strain PCC563" /LENGTH=177 /DNA_ID=CAMNT_0014385325 /DNA_START=11 /DNA_END=540 /DNA_ORIENTATION=-